MKYFSYQTSCKIFMQNVLTVYVNNFIADLSKFLKAH